MKDDSTAPPNMDVALRADVFVSTIGRVPASAAADLRSFFIDVHRCCARWLAAQTEPSLESCAFVLSERLDLDPVYEQHAHAFRSTGRLDGSPPADLPGSIMLTSRNLRLAFARRCEDSRVGAMVQELRRLGLANRPTAFFLPAELTLMFYPCGIDDRPSFRANTAILGDLDPSDIAGLIDYFHENWTRFPDGLGACWDNAGLRIVERNAERNIRNQLFVFLSMVVYGTQYIAREYQLPNGRVDIFIYGVIYNNASDHRVLELKVLRSRASGWRPDSGKARSYSKASNKRYVERGLRQAHRYKVAANATEAFLFCFDARLEDEDVGVDSYASTLGVQHRRYYLESSTKEA